MKEIQRAEQQEFTVLAFDVGGTRIKAGIVQNATVLTQCIEDGDEYRDVQHLLERLLHLGHRLMVTHTIDAVGMSIKGIVDPYRGVLVDVNESLMALIGEPLVAQLTTAFHVPTVLENDARMYTLGELLYGAGRTAKNLVCITLGTGVGTGVALNGRVLRGARGLAGILGGHLTLQTDGPLCTCGNIGCLEALIGTAALQRQTSEALATGRPSVLLGSLFTPQQLFAAAASGDGVACEVVEHFTRWLGTGIVSLIHAHDPDVVVLGGGIMGAAQQFLPAVQTYVSEHTWTLPSGHVSVVQAERGDVAALLGVAAFARHSDILL